jgi:small neutral amino acid transporter SnatA (MarC family)
MQTSKNPIKREIASMPLLPTIFMICMGVQFVINGVLEVVRTFH